jgi:hypothetical protein
VLLLWLPPLLLRWLLHQIMYMPSAPPNPAGTDTPDATAPALLPLLPLLLLLLLLRQILCMPSAPSQAALTL